MKEMTPGVQRDTCSLHVPWEDVITWHSSSISVLHHLVKAHNMGAKDILALMTHVFEIKEIAQACRALADELDEYVF